MLRIVGDIHDERGQYLNMIRPVEYSLQVGDLDGEGFDWLAAEKIDPSRHRFLTGNHDNMPKALSSPYNLGDFGVWEIPDWGSLFFVRGAKSIDGKARNRFPVRKGGKVIPANYWPEQEQLGLEQARASLERYKQVKPDFVVSHECPYSLVPRLSDPLFMHRMGYTESVLLTETNGLLEKMREYHKPKVHVFGHYHTDFDEVVDGTRYVCVKLWRFKDFPAP